MPVTGGYRGIGAAISEGLAAMGAKIAVTGIEAGQAREFAHALQAGGHDAYSAAFDVLSVDDTQRMVDGVVERFGRLDIFVNRVGVNREQRAGEVTEDVFDHIGSVRTQLALRGRGYAAYCASKGLGRAL